MIGAYVSDLEMHLNNYQDSTAQIIIRSILEANGDPQGIFITGGMGGGKSSVVTDVAFGLMQKGREVIALKPAADTSRTDDHIYTRRKDHRNFLSALNVTSITQGIQLIDSGLIRTGSVCVVNEAPFLGSPQDTLEFQETALKNGITVITEGLALSFNGKIIPAAEVLLQTAHQRYFFHPYNSFNPSVPACMTWRGVRVNRETGSIDRQHLTDAVGYLELINQEPLRIQKIVSALLESTYAHELLLDSDRFILIPSYLSDPVLAYGTDRYKSTDRATYYELYKLAGIPIFSETLLTLDDVENMYPATQPVCKHARVAA